MELNFSDNRTRELFRDYYSVFIPNGPEMISSREIGYIPFGGSMTRHLNIPNHEELKRFVKQKVPRHIYYSAAYYRNSSERNMQDKEWMGSELIFDLDADHIKNADRLTYGEILDQVKSHTIRLVEKFLMDDFGFTPEEIKIFFSGGRGYHVHIVSEKVYSMDADMRREISNYVRGEGLNIQDIRKTVRHVDIEDSGWIGSFDRYLSAFYSRLNQENEIQILRDIMGSKSARYIEKIGKKLVDRVQKLVILSMPGTKKYSIMDEDDEKVAGYLLTQFVDSNLSEIDSPVTSDLHRLIRLPGSLHGKTAMMVKQVDLDSLKDFNPLSDAIPEVFKKGEDRIEVRSRTGIRMNGQDFEMDPGQTILPRYLALYMVTSGKAQFI